MGDERVYALMDTFQINCRRRCDVGGHMNRKKDKALSQHLVGGDGPIWAELCWFRRSRRLFNQPKSRVK